MPTYSEFFSTSCRRFAIASSSGVFWSDRGRSPGSVLTEGAISDFSTAVEPHIAQATIPDALRASKASADLNQLSKP